jgi:hypothetical protein
MATVIINDTLQTYTPGPGVPAGFQTTNVVFSAEFINFNLGRPPTPAPGFYERQGIGFFFFGNNLQFPTQNNLASYPVMSTSVFWAGFGFPEFGLLSLSDSPPYQGPTLLTTKLEADYSVSISIPNVANANSLKQVYYENTWQYWQLNIQIGSIVIGGVAYATVEYQLAVDGVQVFNTGVAYVSGIQVSTMYLGFPVVNAWQWTGSVYYGEFTIYNGLTAFPFFPNPGITIDMLASQEVVEYVSMPNSNSMRKSQDVVETVQIPSNRNMRKSQDVVEIVIAGAFNQGGGFYVRES